MADHYVEGILTAVERSRRPATRRAHASAWRGFRRWAREEGLPSLPADPITVAAYLVHRVTRGLSISSLEMDRKAISHYHRTAGHPSPTSSEGVKSTLAGLRNQAIDRGLYNPRQARGLTAEVLERIKETACLPRSGPSGRTESVGLASRRGHVDIAIASVMRDALLRRGEAAEHRWRDIEFWHDGSARVTIRKSKTSPGSAVLFIGVDAATALRFIRPTGPDPDGRVFGIVRGRTISNRITAMARAGAGQGVHRTLAAGGHRAGPHRQGHGARRDHGGGPLEVGAHARLLQPGPVGGPQRGGEDLWGLRVRARRVTMILNGQRGVSADTALRLARYFGTTPQLWLNLQKTWELRRAEIETGREISEHVTPRYAVVQAEV